jgi:hypothetical protein
MKWRPIPRMTPDFVRLRELDFHHQKSRTLFWVSDASTSFMVVCYEDVPTR